MENKKFDADKFRDELGIGNIPLQPYDYDRYKNYNPNLTEEIYQHLRNNRAEWKILCGLLVTTHWGQEILKENWWLKFDEKYKESDFYKYRFAPEIYLKMDW